MSCSYPPALFIQESCALTPFGWVLLRGPMAQRTVEEDPSCCLIYGTHISIVTCLCTTNACCPETLLRARDTSSASSYPTDAEVYLGYLGHELKYLT